MIVEEQEVRRGEIYHADLNPVFGSEQGGYRIGIVQRSLLQLSRADQRQNCRHMYRLMESKDLRKSLLSYWSRSGHWIKDVWMILLAG